MFQLFGQIGGCLGVGVEDPRELTAVGRRRVPGGVTTGPAPVPLGEFDDLMPTATATKISPRTTENKKFRIDLPKATMAAASAVATPKSNPTHATGPTRASRSSHHRSVPDQKPADFCHFD